MHSYLYPSLRHRYDDTHTEADLIGGFLLLVDRYRNAKNILGAELFNEPYAATWGDGSVTDWRAAAGRIGNAILDTGVGWLIFVQGTSQCQYCFYGEGEMEDMCFPGEVKDGSKRVI